jgi:hypothetical protein
MYKNPKKDNPHNYRFWFCLLYKNRNTELHDVYGIWNWREYSIVIIPCTESLMEGDCYTQTNIYLHL